MTILKNAAIFAAWAGVTITLLALSLSMEQAHIAKYGDSNVSERLIALQ